MSDLRRLTDLATQLEAARVKVECLEDQLAEAKRRVDKLEGHDIPELMQELDMQKFELGSGTKLVLDTKVSAGAGGVRNPKLHQWLRDIGHAGLIKSAVTVPFGAGKDAEALELVKSLTATGLAADYAQTVHAGSLSSTVKKLLQDGTAVPSDLIHVFPRVKVTLPR